MKVRNIRQKIVAELDKYIILDTHGGPEDIIAIVAAIKLAKQLQKTVIGITCVAGRRNVDQAAEDALLAVRLANAQIPIYKGARQSILLNKTYPECYNLSKDYKALNDLVKEEVNEQHRCNYIKSQFAPLFIADQIRKYEAYLTIITLGPLTNLALAFHQSQNITELSRAFTGVGNVVNQYSAEGNFRYDPQAAHVVISNYKNVYINPIEKTLQHSWLQLFNKIGQKDRDQRLVKIQKIITSNGHTTCGPLLTILPVFHKQIVSKTYNVYSEVITTGQMTVGLLACNWLRLGLKPDEQEPNVKIYSLIDFELANKYLVSVL